MFEACKGHMLAPSDGVFVTVTPAIAQGGAILQRACLWISSM